MDEMTEDPFNKDEPLYELDFASDSESEPLYFELNLEADEETPSDITLEEELDLSELFDDTEEMAEVVIELEDDDVTEENLLDLIDNLDLPGAEEISQLVSDEPKRTTTWEDDGDHSKFIEYVVRRLQSIPHHSGQTTVGCEKAMSYLRKLDKEISKAIQSDEDNVIDEATAERIRDKIHDFISQLEDAYYELTSEKRKRRKKASSFSLGKTIYARINDGKNIEYFASVTASDGEERLLKVEIEEPTPSEVQAFIKGDKGLTKEAGQLMTFVDPFLQSITRLLITAHVRNGKDIRDVYSQLDAQYNFTPREQLSIHELLLQKGLGLNVDLGRLQEKEVSSVDGNNVEFSTEYYA